MMLDKPQSQTYVANPQTYTAPQRPAWLQAMVKPWINRSTPDRVTGPNASQLLAQPETPWRMQNPDGSWAYLQNDGTYLTATGTAGQDDIIARNSYIRMPPLQQLQPPAAPGGYSPFSSYYSGWGRRGGGGGGGGYSYNPQVPAWYMGLNSWNFGE